MPLTNADIAELLAARADHSEGHRQRAYGRAAGWALMWPEEAAAVAGRSESLQALPGVGPSLERRIHGWLEDGSPVEPIPARRGFVSYAAALEIVRARPEWRQALRGDLQMHTTFSDGKSSIREMALAAAERGYDYIAITDHSQGLRVARGMSPEVLRSQVAEVAEVSAELRSSGIPVRLLHGIEMNLDARGQGDMDAQHLGGLDLVVGSFHSDLRSKEDQTDRYLGALANPAVNIIGHPTTRRFNRRGGLRADWSLVFDAAAASGTALEINAHPHRQDLSVELLRQAEEAGATFSIGTDAHSVAELAFVEIALSAAIVAGIHQDRIVNFWELERVVEWARR